MKRDEPNKKIWGSRCLQDSDWRLDCLLSSCYVLLIHGSFSSERRKVADGTKMEGQSREKWERRRDIPLQVRVHKNRYQKREWIHLQENHKSCQSTSQSTSSSFLLLKSTSHLLGSFRPLPSSLLYNNRVVQAAYFLLSLLVKEWMASPSLKEDVNECGLSWARLPVNLILQNKKQHNFLSHSFKLRVTDGYHLSDMRVTRKQMNEESDSILLPLTSRVIISYTLSVRWCGQESETSCSLYINHKTKVLTEGSSKWKTHEGFCWLVSFIWNWIMIDMRRNESESDASQVNKRDCLYKTVDLLLSFNVDISLFGNLYLLINSNLTDMRTVQHIYFYDLYVQTRSVESRNRRTYARNDDKWSSCRFSCLSS